MSVVIDVPQVAYKTWVLEYRIYDKDGKRNHLMEYEAERDLEKALVDVRYSAENDHVR